MSASRGIGSRLFAAAPAAAVTRSCFMMRVGAGIVKYATDWPPRDRVEAMLTISLVLRHRMRQQLLPAKRARWLVNTGRVVADLSERSLLLTTHGLCV